jgi:predicted AlkP superfamily pyrophosphatase or phosphodiesterase
MPTGFPSTTATSLATFGTGLPPGATGMAGYSVRDPATKRRTTLIGWESATAPERWQPHPTVFETLAEAGHPAVFVGERRFHRSALTAASLRGARFVGAGGLTARVAAAAEAARQPGTVVYLYWGEIDKAAHTYGWHSWEWLRAVEALDSSMAQLRAGLPRTAALWLTADHGMVDAESSTRIDVAAEPTLAKGLDLMAGEARAVHLYGPDPEAIAQRWRTRLGPSAWVLTQAEAGAAGLFGPSLDPRVAPIVGDVVVAAAGTTTIVDSRWAAPAALAMIGHHGSLTAQEMEIPLIEVVG